MSDYSGGSPGWYTKVIRLPVYPKDESSANSPWYFEVAPNDYYNNLLRPVVDYCAGKNVYAVIDWHYVGHNTFYKLNQTNAFWAYIAPKFANDSHVIFELFNEPLNNTGSDAANWASVKADMETWIGIVRASAPENLIFVGMPSWCQIIGPTATNPVSDDNVVYVTHIYQKRWCSSPKYHCLNQVFCLLLFDL